jgi:hypothetical protein
MEEKLTLFKIISQKKNFDGILDNNFDCFTVILSLYFTCYLLLTDEVAHEKRTKTPTTFVTV